jgi:hypothetical protein
MVAATVGRKCLPDTLKNTLESADVRRCMQHTRSRRQLEHLYLSICYMSSICVYLYHDKLYPLYHYTYIIIIWRVPSPRSDQI